MKQIREQDTDWKKWLMTKPDRPFDPQRYFEFRLYREFSSGIADQWMSHGIDLVHFFMNDQPPRSVMAHGGVFAWHDGRENPDTFQALLEYPKGFLASFSTSFGNDSRQLHAHHGQEGDAREHRRRGQPALEGRRRAGQPRGQPRGPPRRTLGHFTGQRQAGPDQYRRRGPVAPHQLARVPAQPQHAHERHRGQRFSPLGGVHHGGAVVLARQADVLRREGRAHHRHGPADVSALTRRRVSVSTGRSDRLARRHRDGERRTPAACLEDEAETQPELPLVDPFPGEILHAGDRHEVLAVADVVVGDPEVRRVREVERLHAELQLDARR